MAEAGLPASSSSSSSPSSPRPVRTSIPEEQLHPAAAPPPPRADTSTVAVPPESGGGVPSLEDHSPLTLDPGGSTPVPSSPNPSCPGDPYPDRSPTVDAGNASASTSSTAGRSAEPSSRPGRDEPNGMTLAPGPPALPFVSPTSVLPATSLYPECSHPTQDQASSSSSLALAPAPTIQTGGAGTAHVSVVANKQPSGGFSAAVSIHFGGADAGESPAPEPVVPSGSHVVVPRAADQSSTASASSYVTWADDVAVMSDKQKGKLPAKDPSPLDATPDRAMSPPIPSSSSSAAALPDWKKSSGRPPQKLPIRFKDAVGRNHVWPWKVAKTWKGAKRLIDASFQYMGGITEAVDGGYYDLFIHNAWEEPPRQSPIGGAPPQESAEVSASSSAPGSQPPSEGTSVQMSSVVSPIVVVDQEPVEPGPSTQPVPLVSHGQSQVETVSGPPGDDVSVHSGSPTLSSSSSFFTASPPPSPPAAPADAGAATSSSSLPVPPPPGTGTPSQFDLHLHGVYLPPELWDDLVEPGMYISMHLRPYSNYHPPGYPAGTSLNLPPLPLAFGNARGRGRGRGGPGRGMPVMPPGMMGSVPPPPPPGWPHRRPPIIIEIPRPRGKTRKRQDGL